MDRPSSDQSDRSATKGSTGNRSHRSPGTGNTGHRSHQSLVTQGAPVRPVKPGAPTTPGQPGAPVTPGQPGAPVTPVNTGQKALEARDTQLLHRSELIVLNSPVRPVQLEHNVHESSDLLNSDSLDDRADESPERSILCHSRHRSRVILAPVILVTPAPVIPAPVTLVTCQIVSIQSTEHIQLGLML